MKKVFFLLFVFAIFFYASSTNAIAVDRRFIGGTDCAKEFVWHNALYPRAAQQQFGITNDCPLLAAAQLPDQGPGPGPTGTGDDLLWALRRGAGSH